MPRQSKPDSFNSQWAKRRQEPDFIEKKAKIEADREANNQANRNREVRRKCAAKYYESKQEAIARLGKENYFALKNFINQKREELGFKELHIPKRATSKFYTSKYEILPDLTFDDLLIEVEDEMKNIQWRYRKIRNQN
jgi:hypothetical protein